MQQAYCDSLTGLANRSLFEQRLDRALDRIRTGSGRAALFLLDLDDFKGVNDTLGHHVGDELLVALTDRLRSRTREGDTLCRFGGDEFLVLAEDVGEGDVEPMARRIMSV
ncbi:MAG: GGDEF domain-containing protein, partial [Actinomycetota bacterium]|nr:GGDEF domain-containing protein [Actinomycetota bacterium]